MAKVLNSDTPGVGHNQLTTEQRAAIELEACETLARLDEERKSFNALQTKARKEVMGGMVKGQLGMTSRDFINFIYTEHKLQQDDENEEALRMHRLAKARAWQRVPVGTQKSLFEELKLGDQGERLSGNGAPKKEPKAGGRGRGKKAAKAGDEDFVEDQKPTGAQLN